MKAIVNTRILLPENEIRGKALLFDETVVGVAPEETARSLADEVIDAGGAICAPGLIDTHIHGYGGVDVSDDDPEDILRMAARLPENGVTSFLPTTLTLSREAAESVCRHVSELLSSSAPRPGAEILGLHLEGPFVNPARKGAQNAAWIRNPDAEEILPFKDIVKLVTFAPEMPGGMDFIETLREKAPGVCLSMGHTEATCECALQARQMGVTRVTHLFNAMPGLHHRNPGVVGAALSSDLYTELIPDTFHVDKALFPMLARAKGDHLILITDSLRCAGLPDGTYENGGQSFTLRGIECRLADGTIAGSVLRLNLGVRNLYENGGISLSEAFNAASLNPAASLGIDNRKGSISEGKDADFFLMTDDFTVLKTFVRGKCVYKNPRV